MALSMCERESSEGRDLRPLAVLSLAPEQLADRLLLRFETVDDDLDRMLVCAVTDGASVFLLMRGLHEPTDGTNLLTAAEGEPMALTRDFLDAAGLGMADVALQWDGAEWVPPRVTSAG